MSCCL